MILTTSCRWLSHSLGISGRASFQSTFSNRVGIVAVPSLLLLLLLWCFCGSGLRVGGRLRMVRWGLSGDLLLFDPPCAADSVFKPCRQFKVMPGTLLGETGCRRLWWLGRRCVYCCAGPLEFPCWRWLLLLLCAPWPYPPRPRLRPRCCFAASFASAEIASPILSEGRFSVASKSAR